MSSKLFLYIQNFSSDHKRYKEGGREVNYTHVCKKNRRSEIMIGRASQLLKGTFFLFLLYVDSSINY